MNAALLRRRQAVSVLRLFVILMVIVTFSSYPVIAQKGETQPIPGLPLVLGQPFDGTITTTAAPQVFTFTSVPSQELFLTVETAPGVTGLDLVVRDPISAEVLVESNARFNGVQLHIPTGSDSYVLELTSGQPNVSIPYHVCLGGQSGNLVCPTTMMDLTSQQAAPLPTVPPAPVTAGSVLDFSLPTNYGTVTLTGGFTPDPFTIDITSGGTVSASYLGTGCTGYATAAPDFSVNYVNPSGFLSFSFVGDGDTTLIINTPGGSYTCDDDSGDGLNPRVDFFAPVGGRYDVWVASYSSDTYVSGSLYVTELASHTPPQTSQAIDYTLPPNFGSVNLTSGFVPDPYPQTIVAGGTVNAASLGSGCTGWVSAAPDFSVRYSGGVFPMLRFYFVGNGDATMIVNRPDGRFICADDSFLTLSPTIDIESPGSGRYDIWIGSYAEGRMIPGTLFVTENLENHPG